MNAVMASAVPIQPQKQSPGWIRWGADLAVRRVQNVVREIFKWYTVEERKLRNMAIGIMALNGAKPLIDAVETLTLSRMRKLVGHQGFNQSMAVLFVKSHAYRFGPALVGSYIALIEPVMMTVFCWGDNLNWMKSHIDKLPISDLAKKVVASVAAAVLFAVCHLSPLQNITTNMLCLLTMLALGIVLSILREATGGLYAPTTVHALVNIAALGALASRL